MFKKIKNNIELILPKRVFFFLLIIYQSIKYKSLKNLFYNEDLDREINEKNLINISIDKQEIVSVLKTFSLDYYDPNLSWHYLLCAGLFKNSNYRNILEIGTELGRFTNFISKGFKSSKIYTIDLNENQLPKDPSYNYKENNINRNNFVRERSINLNEENINFIEMNSFDLLKYFEKDKFDLIWLDGDHTNPQVTMDVLSAYYLLKKNGILITDDLYLNQNYSDNFLSQGLQPIKYLTEIKKLKTFYFIKKISRKNAFPKIKKFISFSIKI